MIDTPEAAYVTGLIRKAEDAILDRAFRTAVAAEIEMMRPDCRTRQYEAGKIDACVAILKGARPKVDWLADIRLAAEVERNL